jgi:hypothetical protein
MNIVKTIVIWLVKIFKLEEVFLKEFKELLKSKLTAKLNSLEDVVKSIESSNGVIKEIESAVGAIPKYLLGNHNMGLLDAAKKELSAIESGVSGLKTEIKKDIEELF